MKSILIFSLVLALTSCSFENNKINPTESLNEVSLEEAVKIEPLSWVPRVFLVRHFLTDKECNHLIEISKGHLTPSVIVDNYSGQNKVDGVRTSAGTFMAKDHKDSIVNSIEDRISLLTLIPRENGENLQILHYDEGGEFKPHYDYFNLMTPGGVVNFRQGGQRVASFLMYLNTPEEGGETIFPTLEIKVTPRKGDALLFFDCCLDGRTDPLTFHGGLPVLKGEKWLATKWFRQSAYHKSSEN